MNRYRVVNINLKRKKVKIKLKKIIIFAVFLILVIAIPCCIFLPSNNSRDIKIPSFIIKEHLTPNKYSRSQKLLKKVKNIVIHYVANPGSSARANRNYFENLQYTKKRSVSSHFIVGLEGEVIQCIPLKEVAYANYPRNGDTVSIEVCHPDSTGKYSDITYNTVVKLASWLCCEYNLSYKDVIRHHDVSGKNCPKYYVEHPKAWKQLRLDIKQKIKDMN